MREVSAKPQRAGAGEAFQHCPELSSRGQAFGPLLLTRVLSLLDQ